MCLWWVSGKQNIFMYSRSISEKKTNSIAMIISTPEHGKQTLHLQAAVADKFIPYSCKELHGEVWASLSGFQFINWSQQLARVPRARWPLVTCGSIRISWMFIPLYPHTRAADPFLCSAPHLWHNPSPLWSESGKIFPSLHILLKSGIFCGHNSHGGNAGTGHLRGKC